MPPLSVVVNISQNYRAIFIQASINGSNRYTSTGGSRDLYGTLHQGRIDLAILGSTPADR